MEKYNDRSGKPLSKDGSWPAQQACAANTGCTRSAYSSVPPENAAQGLLLCKIKVRTGGIGAPNMVQ